MYQKKIKNPLYTSFAHYMVFKGGCLYMKKNRELRSAYRCAFLEGQGFMTIGYRVCLKRK